MGAASGLSVGLKVVGDFGFAVGSAVGFAVGSAVVLAVGAAVGLAVGAAFGSAVGDAVGFSVGMKVGGYFGLAVGSAPALRMLLSTTAVVFLLSYPPSSSIQPLLANSISSPTFFFFPSRPMTSSPLFPCRLSKDSPSSRPPPRIAATAVFARHPPLPLAPNTMTILMAEDENFIVSDYYFERDVLGRSEKGTC